MGGKSFPGTEKGERVMVVTNPTWPAGKLGPAWGGRGYSRGLKATGLGFRRPQVLVLDLLVSLGLRFPCGKAPIEASTWPPTIGKAWGYQPGCGAEETSSPELSYGPRPSISDYTRGTAGRWEWW